METVVQPPVEPELQLLTQWGSPDDPSRKRRAGVLSLVVHAVAIVALMLIPDAWLEPVKRVAEQHITPLIFEPTQPTPNKGPINKEFDADSMKPQPRMHIPASAPSTTRPAARQQAYETPKFVPPPAPKPAVKPVAPPPLPEPPKVEAVVKEPPRVPVNPNPVLTPPTQQPPPQIQAQETKPKSPFESPSTQAPVQSSGVGRVPVPGASVSEAIRGMMRGSSTGGLTIGDTGTGIGGIGEGINLPPSPGNQGSKIELLSDPMGVDFRPYLIKVLAAVRRNWWAVMPEAARLGRRGIVTIQFSVAKTGSVPKLVIVNGSGTDALDRAAVAGVSASNPFPPLPPEYKGDQIRLQLNFAYNMPK